MTSPGARTLSAKHCDTSVLPASCAKPAGIYAFHNTLIYRVEFWMRLFSILLAMYGIHWVWRVLYTQKPGAFGSRYGAPATRAMPTICFSSPVW